MFTILLLVCLVVGGDSVDKDDDHDSKSSENATSQPPKQSPTSSQPPSVITCCSTTTTTTDAMASSDTHDPDESTVSEIPMTVSLSSYDGDTGDLINETSVDIIYSTDDVISTNDVTTSSTSTGRVGIISSATNGGGAISTSGSSNTERVAQKGSVTTSYQGSTSVLNAAAGSMSSQTSVVRSSSADDMQNSNIHNLTTTMSTKPKTATLKVQNTWTQSSVVQVGKSTARTTSTWTQPVTDQSASSTTTPLQSTGIKYSCLYRIANKQFVPALSNKTSNEYISFANTVNLLMIAVYKTVLASRFMSIVDISFSAGSVVVNTTLLFTLQSDPITASELSTVNQQLNTTFAKDNLTLDNIIFLPSPLAPPPTPPPPPLPPPIGASGAGMDSMLLIGLVAGTLVIVCVVVIVLSIFVCRSRRHKSSTTSSQVSIVSHPNRSVASDYNPSSPAGMPPARKSTMLWKGNKTAMNDPGEFDENYTYWRSTADIRVQQSPQHARQGRGKPAALPGNRKNTAPEPEQNSETESSDWRYVPLSAENESRPLTGWLQRAVNNAAGRKVGKPEIAAASSRDGNRLRRIDPQSAAIMEDVDDESLSVRSFNEMPYPVNPGNRGPLPAIPPGMMRNPAISKGGVRQPMNHPPSSRGSRAGQHSGFGARPSHAGFNRSFYHANAGGGGYEQGSRPVAWGLPTRPSNNNHGLQRNVYLP